MRPTSLAQFVEQPSKTQFIQVYDVSRLLLFITMPKFVHLSQRAITTAFRRL